MRSGKGREAMPDGLAGGSSLAAEIAITNEIEILERLRVDVNFRSGLPAKIFNLFNNAAFRAMPPV